MTFYDELGIKSDATTDEIKKKYRELAFEFHPDHHTGDDGNDFGSRMAKISEAYEVLSDPRQRHKYDATLRDDSAWMSGASSGFGTSANHPPPPPFDACMMCASTPSALITLRGQQGWIIRRRRMEMNGRFCRNCGKAMFRMIQNRTMIQGWWGITAFFFNFFTILGNLGAIFALRGIGPPTPSKFRTTAPLPFPAPKGRPLLFRAGIWVSVLALYIAGVLIFEFTTSRSATTSSSSSAPTPTPTPSPSGDSSADPYATDQCVTTSGNAVTGVVACSQNHYAQIVGSATIESDCPFNTTQTFKENYQEPNPGRVICLDNTK